MFKDAVTLLFHVLFHLLSAAFFHPLVQHTLRAVLFVLGGGATYVLSCLWPTIKRAHPPLPLVYGRPFARRDPSPRSSPSDTKIGDVETSSSVSDLDLDLDSDDDADSSHESFAPERYGFSLVDRSLIGFALCCTHACLFSKFIIIRSVELSLKARSIFRQQHRSFVVARAARRAAAAERTRIALELEEARRAQAHADSLPPPPEPAPLWWATTTKPAPPVVEPVFWEVTMRSGRVHRTYDHPSCNFRSWTVVSQAPRKEINFEPIKPPAVWWGVKPKPVTAGRTRAAPSYPTRSSTSSREQYYTIPAPREHPAYLPTSTVQAQPPVQQQYYYPTATPTPTYFFPSPPPAPTAAFGTTEYLQQVGYLPTPLSYPAFNPFTQLPTVSGVVYPTFASTLQPDVFSSFPSSMMESFSSLPSSTLPPPPSSFPAFASSPLPPPPAPSAPAAPFYPTAAPPLPSLPTPTPSFQPSSTPTPSAPSKGKATRTKDGKMFDAKTSHASSSKAAAGAKATTVSSGSGMKKKPKKPLGATYLC
ncbi:hypothetical protein RQP46_005180 [Phenoliferia psychrophenolica]